MEERAKILKKLPLFSPLDWAAIRSTVGKAEVVVFKRNDVVVQEGEHGEAFYVVDSGRLQAYTRLKSGVERVFAHYYDGDCFGEMALTGEPHWCSVRVLNDAVLLRIRRDDFEEAALKHPELGFRVRQVLAQRIIDLREERKRAKWSTAISLYSVEPHTGKQMLAYNLAASLAAETLEPVALLDLSGRLPGPALITSENLNMTHSKMGFDLLRAPLKGTEAEANFIPHLFSTLIKQYNYVVLSLPEEFSPPVQQCLEQSDRIFVVTTTEEEKIYRTRLFLNELRNLTPYCMKKLQVMGMYEDISSETSLPELEHKLGHPLDRYLERIPRNELSMSPDIEPYVLRVPKARFSHGVRHLARELGNGLVGLALGSGAARGLAHIGIIRVLERENIVVDVVAGNSIGALIAAAWAAGKNADEMEEIALRVRGRGVLRLMDPVFPRGGLLKGEKLRKFLREIFGDKTFAQTLIPLRIGATNLETLEEIVYSQGPLVDAVRASASIPGIFEPVYHDGQAIIDGGMLNPVPIDFLVKMGVNRIIAVNTVPGQQEMRTNVLLQAELRQLREQGGRDFLSQVTEKMIWKFSDSIIDVYMRAMQAMQSELAQAALKNADVVLTPIIPGSAWYQFYEPEKFIRKGEETAMAKLEALRRLTRPPREQLTPESLDAMVVP